MTGPRQIPAAVGRVLSLLADPPEVPDISAGYLDLLGPRPAGRHSVAQALMVSRVVPAVYERWWRPVLAWAAKGFGGPDMTAETVIAADYLALAPGDVVLDIACGPGNFTRRFADLVGEQGLAIGLDASTTMLRRAVRDTAAGNVGYVRGDAVDLPFAGESLDAVCCFAALHLFARPFDALDRITAALAPGGRIALMTSCRRGPWPTDLAVTLPARATGIRMFGRDELTGALRARGYTGVRQQVYGVIQFVGGTLQRR